MARELRFEFIVESKDPEADYHRLLSMRPSEEARKTLRQAKSLDITRLKVERLVKQTPQR